MVRLRGALPSLSLLPFLWAPWIPSVLVIYICMAPHSLAEHARKVENALRSGNAGEARHSVSMIVGRDTERMDVYGIARAAIESVAENLTDGVFSTLFWASAGCLAGGASGAASAALAHRVFNILDAMWGKKMNGTDTSAPLPHAWMTRSTSSPHALFYRVFPFPP